MKTKKQKQHAALVRRTVNLSHYRQRERDGVPLGDEAKAFLATKIQRCETDIANLTRKGINNAA